MTIGVEQLPVEIWLIVFSYLEAHDLFQAFQNLNRYFNQILSSDYLLFNVKLKQSDNNHYQHYSSKFFWPNSILNRIIHLQRANKRDRGCFVHCLRWHSNLLTRLECLSIRIRLRHVSYICTALQQLKSLKYLSMECVPNQILLETILAAPGLRFCYLAFRRTTARINYHSGPNSNIETLSIRFLNESDISIVYLLLSHVPKIKKFEIPETQSMCRDLNRLLNQQIFILHNLRTLKLHYNYCEIDPDCFRHLFVVMPALKRFHFDILEYQQREVIFDNLIQHWWPVIEKIEQATISIRCITFNFEKINLLQKEYTTKLGNYRQIMHKKYDQSSGCFKFEWTTDNLTDRTIVKISIQKHQFDGIVLDKS